MRLNVYHAPVHVHDTSIVHGRQYGSTKVLSYFHTSGNIYFRKYFRILSSNRIPSVVRKYFRTFVLSYSKTVVHVRSLYTYSGSKSIIRRYDFVLVPESTLYSYVYFQTTFLPRYESTFVLSYESIIVYFRSVTTQPFRANGTYSGTRLFSLEKMQIDHDQKVIRNAAVHDGEMRRRKRRARCARVVDARDEADCTGK